MPLVVQIGVERDRPFYWSGYMTVMTASSRRRATKWSSARIVLADAYLIKRLCTRKVDPARLSGALILVRQRRLVGRILAWRDFFIVRPTTTSGGCVILYRKFHLVSANSSPGTDDYSRNGGKCDGPLSLLRPLTDECSSNRRLMRSNGVTSSSKARRLL